MNIPNFPLESLLSRYGIRVQICLCTTERYKDAFGEMIFTNITLAGQYNTLLLHTHNLKWYWLTKIVQVHRVNMLLYLKVIRWGTISSFWFAKNVLCFCSNSSVSACLSRIQVPSQIAQLKHNPYGSILVKPWVSLFISWSSTSQKMLKRLWRQREK